MRWLPHLAVSTRLRLAFALLAGMFAYVNGSLLDAVPWILLVVTLDLAGSGLAYLGGTTGRVRTAQLWALLLSGAMVAGVAIPVVGLSALEASAPINVEAALRQLGI